MNSRIINHTGALIVFGLMIAAIIAFSLSCDRSESPTEGAIVVSGAAGGPITEISGELVSHTGCIWSFAPVSRTGVEWEYDGNGTLDLRHGAAGFNCCPDLDCTVDVEDRTITVTERDYGVCLCLCLAEAEYQITGLPPGKYMLRFDEAVPIGDDEPLECEILLKGNGSSGTFVVDRCSYPWGGCEPTGTLLSCEEVESCCPEYTGCLAWDYSGGFLELTHRNWYGSGGIVSVPSVEFDFSSNNITITEDVMMGPLTVMTCVQFEMMIAELYPGEYHVTLNRFMDLTPVEFTLDLTNEPTGEIGF